MMATNQAAGAHVQVATRVPEALLQRVRIYCIKREQTVMEFVAQALREKLRRVRSRP